MNSSSNKKLKAFTLIELLISITIVSIVVALSVTSYPKFSDQMGVVSEVYQILGYTRETQVFGTSAYVSPGTKIAYSLLIEKGKNTVSRYIILNPTDNTNTYYTGNFTVDATVKNLTIKDRYEINKICVNDDCTQEVDKLYVIFKRPNPEARLVGLTGSVIGPDTATGSYSKVKIQMRSKNNKELVKNFVILQTGQIYVDE